MGSKNINNIRSKIHSLTHEDYWEIGVSFTEIHHFLKDGLKPDVHWLKLTEEKEFAADPFGVIDTEDNSKLHLFFEIFSFQDLKGRIGHAIYDILTQSLVSETQTVLEKKNHLAYPFLVQDKGKTYLIPENAQGRSIDLYESQKFPKEWIRKQTIVENFSGVDNTIFEHGNCWWLFTTDNDAGEHSHLNIFYSETLLGNWKPHKKNPVKIDVSSSRCGGTPFLFEENLYRPAMDNSHEYGKKIVLNKIETLTEKDFHEEPIQTIEAWTNKTSNKIHTLSSSGLVTLVDRGSERSIFSRKYLFTCKLRRIINKFI